MNRTRKGAWYGMLLSVLIAFVVTMSLAVLVQYRGGGGHV